MRSFADAFNNAFSEDLEPLNEKICPNFCNGRVHVNRIALVDFLHRPKNSEHSRFLPLVNRRRLEHCRYICTNLHTLELPPS